MNSKSKGGFTLLEVIISVGILVVLSIAASTLLRNSFDIRFGLAESSAATQRANTVISKISEDLQHLYFIPETDTNRMTANRSVKTYFRLDKGKYEKLSFTTTSHRIILQNAKESELVFVSYELREDPKLPGTTHLYRVMTPHIPEDPDKKLKAQILARNIKEFNIKLWDGDRWSSDRWDSGASQNLNKIPHLIQITVSAWVGEPELTTSGQAGQFYELNTIVYPTMAKGTEEVKKGALNYKWY